MRIARIFPPRYCFICYPSVGEALTQSTVFRSTHYSAKRHNVIYCDHKILIEHVVLTDDKWLAKPSGLVS